MKKNIFKLFLPFIALIPLATTSCGSSELTKITYGSKISVKDATELQEKYTLTYDALKEKMESKSENFILFTYFSDCECGDYLSAQQTMKNLLNNDGLQIFQFDTSKFPDGKSKFGLSVYKKGTLAFSLVKKGELKMEFNTFSNQGENLSMFVNTDGGQFKKKMFNYAIMPSIYYVNDSFLESHIKSDDKLIALFIRETCGDCSYILPNCLNPYLEENYNNIKGNIYMFDLDPFRGDQEIYQNLKDKYFLSNKNDKVFGYSTGVVPTIQYYENGKLKDMCVSFNDELAKDGDNYKISNTYYTSSRVINLKYTNTVLENMTISKDEVEVFGGSFYSWKKEYSSIYHNQILKQFLGSYLK